MSPPPRRLIFGVGTSLLTASLSLGVAGCDDDKPTANPAPEADSKAGDEAEDEGDKPEEPRVNVAADGEGGEAPKPQQPTANPGPEDEINKPGPEPVPATGEGKQGRRVNPGPTK